MLLRFGVDRFLPLFLRFFQHLCHRGENISSERPAVTVLFDVLEVMVTAGGIEVSTMGECQGRAY